MRGYLVTSTEKESQFESARDVAFERLLSTFKVLSRGWTHHQDVFKTPSGMVSTSQSVWRIYVSAVGLRRFPHGEKGGGRRDRGGSVGWDSRSSNSPVPSGLGVPMNPYVWPHSR